MSIHIHPLSSSNLPFILMQFYGSLTFNFTLFFFKFRLSGISGGSNLEYPLEALPFLHLAAQRCSHTHTCIQLQHTQVMLVQSNHSRQETKRQLGQKTTTVARWLASTSTFTFSTFPPLEIHHTHNGLLVITFSALITSGTIYIPPFNFI